MTRASDVEAIPPAEALTNADGEVALFVRPFDGRPVGWRESTGGVVEIVLGGGGTVPFGCAPGPLDVARRRGRILLIQGSGGEASSEAWLPAMQEVQDTSTIP